MKLTREQMKQQAIKFMTALGIKQDVITSLCDKNVIYHFISFNNIYKPVSPSLMKVVYEHEEKTDAFVYLVTSSFIGDILVYDLWTVSPYEDDQEHCERVLADNIVYAYCINTCIPEFSESGSIAVKVIDGFPYRFG